MRLNWLTWAGPLPATNYAPGAAWPLIGLTVHHADGSLRSADAEFRRPGSGKSAHFGLDFDGSGLQWCDPETDVAFTACAANWTGWAQVECASDPAAPDAPPTPAQIASLGRIVRDLGIPAVPATTPSSGGVGWHREFPGDCSIRWGQTDCPGDGFIDAIPAICAAAGGSTPPPPVPADLEAPVLIASVFVNGNNDLFYVDDKGRLWWQHLSGSGAGAPVLLTVNANPAHPEITVAVPASIYGPLLYLRGPNRADGTAQLVRVKLAAGGLTYVAEYV